MISEEHVEYHIKLCNSDNIEQAYLDNTGKQLWPDISKHLKTKVVDLLKIDIDYHEITKSTYIWVHINNVNREANVAKMDSIIAILNEYYTQKVGKYAVPKLMTQICNQLKRSDRYFAEALCEYQSIVGKSRTQDFIHTYFNDIKRTQIYRKKIEYI